MATALLLASRGANIAAMDIKDTDFGALKAAIPEYEKLLVLEGDVANEASFATCVAATMKAYGKIDIFFNNAGVEGEFAMIPDYPTEIFRKVLSVNVVGVFLGLKLVIPHMVKAGSGSIINSSSVAGLTGSPGLCAYTASKHAVLGLTRTAALECGEKGIRVNCVNPGPIEGRMMASIEDGATPDESTNVHSNFAKSIAMKRYGTPEEVAGVVGFLASTDASYVNGAYYTVDGGLTAA